jgi:hypothetical protein
VTDAEFSIQLAVVFNGKPRAYNLDGGFVILGQRIFTMKPGLGGTPADCPNR